MCRNKFTANFAVPIGRPISRVMIRLCTIYRGVSHRDAFGSGVVATRWSEMKRWRSCPKGTKDSSPPRRSKGLLWRRMPFQRNPSDWHWRIASQKTVVPRGIGGFESLLLCIKWLRSGIACPEKYQSQKVKKYVLCLYNTEWNRPDLLLWSF